VVATEDRLAQIARSAPQSMWRRRISLAWIGSISGLLIFQPVPTNAEAAEPAWATVVGIAFLATLGAMAIGLGRRQRWAYTVSGGAGVLGMLLAYACLASGHHLGVWWMIELGVFAGLTALSITAAERTKT
jgi:hypothetical protein